MDGRTEVESVASVAVESSCVTVTVPVADEILTETKVFGGGEVKGVDKSSDEGNKEEIMVGIVGSDVCVDVVSGSIDCSKEGLEVDSDVFVDVVGRNHVNNNDCLGGNELMDTKSVGSGAAAEENLGFKNVGDSVDQVSCGRDEILDEVKNPAVSEERKGVAAEVELDIGSNADASNTVMKAEVELRKEMEDQGVIDSVRDEIRSGSLIDDKVVVTEIEMVKEENNRVGLSSHGGVLEEESWNPGIISMSASCSVMLETDAVQPDIAREENVVMVQVNNSSVNDESASVHEAIETAEVSVCDNANETSTCPLMTETDDVKQLEVADVPQESTSSFKDEIPCAHEMVKTCSEVSFLDTMNHTCPMMLETAEMQHEQATAMVVDINLTSKDEIPVDHEGKETATDGVQPEECDAMAEESNLSSEHEILVVHKAAETATELSVSANAYHTSSLHSPAFDTDGVQQGEGPAMAEENNLSSEHEITVVHEMAETVTELSVSANADHTSAPMYETDRVQQKENAAMVEGSNLSSEHEIPVVNKTAETATELLVSAIADHTSALYSPTFEANGVQEGGNDAMGEESKMSSKHEIPHVHVMAKAATELSVSANADYTPASYSVTFDTDGLQQEEGAATMSKESNLSSKDEISDVHVTAETATEISVPDNTEDTSVSCSLTLKSVAVQQEEGAAMNEESNLSSKDDILVPDAHETVETANELSVRDNADHSSVACSLILESDGVHHEVIREEDVAELEENNSIIKDEIAGVHEMTMEIASEPSVPDDANQTSASCQVKLEKDGVKNEVVKEECVAMLKDSNSSFGNEIPGVHDTNETAFKVANDRQIIDINATHDDSIEDSLTSFHLDASDCKIKAVHCTISPSDDKKDTNFRIHCSVEDSMEVNTVINSDIGVGTGQVIEKEVVQESHVEFDITPDNVNHELCSVENNPSLKHQVSCGSAGDEDIAPESTYKDLTDHVVDVKDEETDPDARMKDISGIGDADSGDKELGQSDLSMAEVHEQLDTRKTEALCSKEDEHVRELSYDYNSQQENDDLDDVFDGGLSEKEGAVTENTVVVSDEQVIETLTCPVDSHEEMAETKGLDLAVEGSVSSITEKEDELVQENRIDEHECKTDNKPLAEETFDSTNSHVESKKKDENPQENRGLGHGLRGDEEVCFEGASGSINSQPENKKEDETLKAGKIKPLSLLSAHQLGYFEPPENDGEFAVSDLVWGKVRSHPWWPGQIFDSSDASDRALKHIKKDSYLVAYFGDRTFAWNDASVLKPFRPHFSQIIKQRNSEVLQTAINGALDEVSRRVKLGLSCSCTPKYIYDRIESQIVENAGIRKESSHRYGVDNTSKAALFEPDKLIDDIQALAKSPLKLSDRLELAIAEGQLSSFCHFKGYRPLPLFESRETSFEDVLETSIDGSDCEIIDVKLVSSKTSTSDKCKESLKDGSLQQPKKERSLSELMVHTVFSPDNDDKSMGVSSTRKRKAIDSAGDEPDRRVSNNPAKVSTTTLSSPKTPSFKVGDLISRVATQLTGGGSSSLKASNDQSVGDPFLHPCSSSPKVPESATSDDMLTQLQLLARDPKKRFGLLKNMIIFLSDFRNTIVRKHTVSKSGGNRKRKTPHAVKKSTEDFEFDDVNDSYWKDKAIENYHNVEDKTDNVVSPPAKIHKPTRKPYTKKRYSNLQINETLVDESMEEDQSIKRATLPAELIMNFVKGSRIPSQMRLNNMFKRFGSLKEQETEIDQDSCRAKVVFKKGSDAEVCYSSLRTFNIFGSMQVTYQLSYSPMTSTLDESSLLISQGPSDHGT